MEYFLMKNILIEFFLIKRCLHSQIIHDALIISTNQLKIAYSVGALYDLKIVILLVDFMLNPIKTNRKKARERILVLSFGVVRKKCLQKEGLKIPQLTTVFLLCCLVRIIAYLLLSSSKLVCVTTNRYYCSKEKPNLCLAFVLVYTVLPFFLSLQRQTVLYQILTEAGQRRI